jgi:hypothetical protein
MTSRWLAVSVLFLACSGPKPPAPVSAQNDVDASPASPDAGETQSTPPPPAETPDAGTTAATPPTPPAPADECTPLAVDFEKRARPKLKECYRDGKKKDPDLKGTVKIALEIDTLGKIKSTKITEKTLPDPVAQCMLKVVKATPFPEAAKCPGKQLTIPMTFPTPP